jgi:hypothetical protein
MKIPFPTSQNYGNFSEAGKRILQKLCYIYFMMISLPVGTPIGNRAA